MKHIPTYGPSCIQVFRHSTCISYINIILERRKHKFSTTNSDFYQVLPSQNSTETFLNKNYENRK